jgi:hypothetical protein
VDDSYEMVQPDTASHREGRKEPVGNRKGRFVRRKKRLENLRPTKHINGNGAKNMRRSAVIC